MKANPSIFAMVLAAALASSGCARDPATATVSAGIAPAEKARPAKAPATDEKPEVDRIVFLDLEECCNCTKNRIDASWNALQAAISGDPAAPPVERLHMDTQSDRAASYQKLKPVMVAPAIYFLDGKGGLAGFLQGEVTENQVTEALGKGSVPLHQE